MLVTFVLGGAPMERSRGEMGEADTDEADEEMWERGSRSKSKARSSR